MMMSFCKNTLHAFLGIAPSPATRPPPPPPSGLISVTEDDGRTPLNVLESASIKPSPKKDSGGGPSEITGGVGGSGVNGLSSCTESLGFESSEQMEESIHESARTSKPTRNTPIDCRNTRCRQGGAEEKEFPPVLSSLKEVGGHYSTSFLKPVRENGRLTLTPVTIERPEVFLASRRDGRLRLQFTKSDQESEVGEESGRQLKKIGPVGSGGEGLRRCQEAMSSDHHHRYNRRNHISQQLLNQQCVTSR